MLGILGLIPAILTSLTGLGNVASSISTNITNLQLAKEKTKSDTEIKSIDAEIAAQHERAAVLVAEAGSRINAFVRAGFAIGPLLYVLKYYAFDKVLGSMWGCTGIAGQELGCSLFRTDGLNTEMTAVLTACITFFFLTTAFGKR